jgi:hypothetical protein
MLYESLVVAEPVAVAVEVVYEFARNMENLPLWASGLSSGIERRDGRWIAQSPMGEVEVIMAADNPFGILDHDVKLPDGKAVHNAFRVTPAGTGSVLAFVVLRMPGTSRKAFDDDVAHVRKDLKALRLLVESKAAGAQIEAR